MADLSARPNILFILVDDMGYGDFGCFNDGLTETPALDHLRRSCICLSQHYTASPICAPARAALQTGRYPHRTGALDPRELRGLCNLALRETTLADTHPDRVSRMLTQLENWFDRIEADRATIDIWGDSPASL